MRFLFFAPQYLPTVGGVERYTYALAKTLVGMGHSVTVATSALPGLLPQEVTAEGIAVFRLPSHLYLKGRFPAPKHSAAFRRMAQELWMQEPDFVLINTRFYPLSLWAVKQCRRRGAPCLVLDHSTGHLSLGSRLPDLAGQLYEHAAMCYIRRRAPLYGVSKACCEWLRHFGTEAKGVLYNAVDPDLLAAIAQHTPYDFRARFSLAGDAPLIVFSGRFIPEKGVQELALALPLIQQENPGAALVMAGDGPEREAILARQQPGLFCPGSLSHEENMALLYQADVFCLPTRYAEGFPTAVLEAAALGTFVVASKAGGTPELLENGKSGILLEDTSSQCIAAAINRVLAAPAFQVEAAVLAKQAVCQRFTWKATAQQLVCLAKTAQKEQTA